MQKSLFLLAYASGASWISRPFSKDWSADVHTAKGTSAFRFFGFLMLCASLDQKPPKKFSSWRRVIARGMSWQLESAATRKKHRRNCSAGRMPTPLIVVSGSLFMRGKMLAQSQFGGLLICVQNALVMGLPLGRISNLWKNWPGGRFRSKYVLQAICEPAPATRSPSTRCAPTSIKD